MGRVLGIDLGTFNSCVALMENGAPQVIADRNGDTTTPSVIGFVENGKRVVGRAAKRQSITNAENTIYAAKRLIGRRFRSPQVQRMASTVAYRITEGPHDDPRIELPTRTYSVPEISAVVLSEMKLIAEDYLGEAVREAVVTVPAYFNDAQRQATRDASAIAGLDAIHILNEPTAAALAYGFGKRVDRTIAVYDLGGGTFDVSILQLTSAGVFKVIATAGDTFLGGEDFDQRIIDTLIRGLRSLSGIDVSENRMAIQRIRDAAEQVKCELSTATHAEVNLPFLATSEDGQPIHLVRSMARSELEELTRDLVEKTIVLCASTLDESHLTTADIDDVLLVGGMSRMPLVQRSVARYFGRDPNAEIDPDKVVAMGAAVQGAALREDVTDMVLLDVTPHTLGIVVAGGWMEELIPQNSTVPVSRGKVFTTVRDHQTTVKIIVVQGESRRAEENELLGEFAVTQLRDAPAGAVQIEVTFELDMDGIVHVRAKNLETRDEQSISITRSSGLTSEELDKMIEEAATHSLAKKADDALDRARLEAAQILGEIDELTPRVQAAVAGSDFAQRSVEDALATVRRARSTLEQGEPGEVSEQIEILRRTLKLFRGAAAGA
ncbi:MAG: molecular chaperone DnaK [Sandaracinaceae bacterium]